jgi:pimeloyl-ACP methyl ester carboxylesterase
MFNPEAHTFAMMRQLLGGSPAATESDPEAFAQMCAHSEQMSAMFGLLEADEDGGQGEGYWAEYLRLSFHRTTWSPGYTFEDLAKVSAPTLILVGDRDDYCTLEDGVVAYRQLPGGEIAVVPGTGHFITLAKMEAERFVRFPDHDVLPAAAGACCTRGADAPAARG